MTSPSSPCARNGRRSSGTRARPTAPAESDSDAIDALAAEFSSRERGAIVVATDSDEFETDTFPRVNDDVDDNDLRGGSSVPDQQRSGFRAFAERAIGGR